MSEKSYNRLYPYHCPQLFQAGCLVNHNHYYAHQMHMGITCVIVVPSASSLAIAMLAPIFSQGLIRNTPG